MGFVTSFILISIAGFWSYYLYHRYAAPKGHKAFLAWYAFIIVAGLMILDILIYVGIFDFVFPILNQLPWVHVDNGKDFMWNSFISIGIDWGIDYTDRGLNFIAVFLLLSYPMWFKFWSNGSQILFGGIKPHYQGMWYLLQPTRKPKEGQKIAKTPQAT